MGIRPFKLVASLGLGLLVLSACSSDGVSPDEQAGDTSSSTDASTDSSGDTSTSDAGETDSGETDSGETDSGDPPDGPCKWTNFPSQYGIGSTLGQNCGQLSSLTGATLADIELAHECLEQAYLNGEAAYATVAWSDGGDNNRRVGWYVRPPEEAPAPRRIETNYFKEYVEEGEPSTGSMTVQSCGAFVLNCGDFPSDFCEACAHPTAPIPCEE